ncbi:hypothetical protein EKO27_g942 [Xylaria grammica]|uniref:Zn(2)-C6 fungal-type domain-containing protein n=1 Tax=Xylaria grammica TaxID=363999 RepID=A0A439DIE3_9PEZI|nr:hypothetical protein EKO27_g942 [Xylaria grammica]
MSSMSRNDSVNSLMGFSVHQPAIGSPLQFFPAMGSQQLDEMIDAYVPGDDSILDKRAAVSLEFFEHSMATGELFKFFMVYPALGSTNTSPTMDSGYHSSFTTSPAMSEGQWNSYSPQMASPSSSKKASSPNDFSNLPGMKIMTKDGRDVTNSASRGCKTKEQRDHAHLMRIIKACDSCRRKKTKCDPSHKRPAAGTSSGKITKKTSKTPRPAAAPPQTAAKQALATTEFDQILSTSSSSLDSFFTDGLNAPTDAFSMEWDQFIQYDEEPAETIPYDYDFFLDPAGFFSPATTASFPSSSTSPSQQPITPIDRDVNITDDVTEGHDHRPILPYLNPGGLEAGSNYVDFNLYSPDSSFLDDDDLGSAKEVAASPIQSQRLVRHSRGHTNTRQEAANSAAAFESSSYAVNDDATYSRGHNVISDAIGDGLLHDTSNYIHQWSEGVAVADATSQGVLHSQHASMMSNRQAGSSYAALNTFSAELSAVDNVFEDATSEGLYGRETIGGRRPSRPLSHSNNLTSPTIPSTTESGSERLRDRQAVPQGRSILRASGIGAIAPTEPPSSQPSALRSCGQNGRSSAESSVTNFAATSSLPTQVLDDNVRTSLPFTIGLELKVSQHKPHNVRYATRAPAPVLRVPSRPENPPPCLSPSPSPVLATDDRDKRSPTGELSSRTTSGSKQQMTRSLFYVEAAQLVAPQDRGSTVSWIPTGAFQYSASASHGASDQRPAFGDQLEWPNRLSTMPMGAGLSLFLLEVSLSSLRTTIVKDGGFIEDAQSDVSGKAARDIAAMMLLSMALCAPPALISFLSIIALPIVAGVRRRWGTPSPIANAHLSARQPHIGLVSNAKATCAKIMHVLRCDLARTLKFKGHPQSPRTGPSESSRTLRWAIPLV